jgi:hypothetical protein
MTDPDNKKETEVELEIEQTQLDLIPVHIETDDEKLDRLLDEWFKRGGY